MVQKMKTVLSLKMLRHRDLDCLLGENNDHIENFDTSEINHFIHWCKLYFLDLNVKKTKEMIIDFHENKPILGPIKINNSAVDIVKTYKYLGSIIDKLNSNENIEKMYKKANQRMHSVRKLKKCQCFINLL